MIMDDANYQEPATDKLGYLLSHPKATKIMDALLSEKKLQKGMFKAWLGSDEKETRDLLAMLEKGDIVKKEIELDEVSMEVTENYVLNKDFRNILKMYKEALDQCKK